MASVFTNAQGEVKRSIIKILSQPIQNMPMNSPEIFRLLEDIPKGAEAMVTRVLHIVTEKGKFQEYIHTNNKQYINIKSQCIPIKIHILTQIFSKLENLDLINFVEPKGFEIMYLELS